jgi:hypothetical protein
MTDDRFRETQQLRFEIELLRSVGNASAARPLLRREAELREELAREQLARGEPDGWIDLLAAVTAWTHFGSPTHARGLLSFGQNTAMKLLEGSETVTSQLAELECWISTQRVLPALSEYAISLPAGALAA